MSYANYIINGHIAVLTLSRPQQANALHGAMLSDIIAAIRAIHKSPARVLCIVGEGKHFCGGADLKWLVESKADALKHSQQIADMLTHLWQLPIPIIAAVQGACYGGGVGIAAVADICITTATTKFCCSEVKIGLIPAIVSPYIIRAMGERQAARYFMSAEIFDGKQATAMGLTHEVVSHKNLHTRMNELAKTIAQCAPLAVRDIKKRTRKNPKPSITESKTNAKALAAAINGKEARAGIAAFFAKQPPPWQGNAK